VAVKKGQSLNKGALAFTIVSPELEAKLQQAQAGEAAAGALSQEAEQGARAQQIAAAKDQWLKAKSAALLYQKTFQRIDNLYRDGVVALQKRDEAQTRWQSAQLTQNAAWQQYLSEFLFFLQKPSQKEDSSHYDRFENLPFLLHLLRAKLVRNYFL
jgi:HlyD family secretion protein